MSPTPQEDISTLIRMRRAIRARRPLPTAGTKKPPVSTRERKALRAEAAARWDLVYAVIGGLQRAYNEAQNHLEVDVRLRKSFPDTWQPVYVVTFSRPGDGPWIEILLTMRKDNVVAFTIGQRPAALSDAVVVREGTTVGDHRALQHLFREVVRCFFLRD